MSKCFNRDCDYCKDCVCTFNNGKNIEECRWYEKEMKMSKASDFVDLLNKEMYELKISNLEAKLAESENEADRYKKWHDDVVERNKQLKQQLAEKERKIKGLGLYSKNVIDFAVEQLEKVKELLKSFDGNYNGSIDCCETDILNIIDNQIAELKKGVE